MRHLPTGAPLGLLALLAASGCIELELRDPLPLQAGGMAVIAYEGETDQVHVISGDAKAVVTPNKEISSLSLFPCAPERYGLEVNTAYTNTRTGSVLLQPQTQIVYSDPALEGAETSTSGMAAIAIGPDYEFNSIQKDIHPFGQEFLLPPFPTHCDSEAPILAGSLDQGVTRAKIVGLTAATAIASTFQMDLEEKDVVAGAASSCTGPVLVTQNTQLKLRVKHPAHPNSASYDLYLSTISGRHLALDIACTDPPTIVVARSNEDTTRIDWVTFSSDGQLVHNEHRSTPRQPEGNFRPVCSVVVDPQEPTSVFLSFADSGNCNRTYSFSVSSTVSPTHGPLEPYERVSRLSETEVLLWSQSDSVVRTSDSEQNVSLCEDPGGHIYLLDLARMPSHWLFLCSDGTYGVSPNLTNESATKKGELADCHRLLKVPGGAFCGQSETSAAPFVRVTGRILNASLNSQLVEFYGDDPRD